MQLLLLAPHAAALHAPRISRAPAPIMLANDPAKTLKRAEFWEEDTCTLLDVANVLGRFESSDEWALRRQFAAAQSRRSEDMAQGATIERFEFAQRNKLVERVAFQQNIPQLKFKDAKVAASFGKSVKEFNAMPVDKVALDVVYDALAQSKASMFSSKLCDQRRANLVTDAGIDEAAFSFALGRARFVVILSWFFYGKGRILGVATVVKITIDALNLIQYLPEGAGAFVDPLLLFGALTAAFGGISSKRAVFAATSDYATISYEAAVADQLANKGDDTKYSTVFEKWAAKSKGKDVRVSHLPPRNLALYFKTGSAVPWFPFTPGHPALPTPIHSHLCPQVGDVNLATEPWVIPLAIVLVGILAKNVYGGFMSGTYTFQ